MKGFNLIFFILLFITNFLFSQKINKAIKPSWVSEIDFDYRQNITIDDESSSYSYFLYDFQVNVTKQSEYYHYAYKIFNNKGVEDASKLYFNYNPSYQKIVLHSIIVRRNNSVIDKLSTSRISDIQREENLEYNIYDGNRTISVIVDDVKAEDIIEYDYTIIGYNPIFRNKFFYSFYLNGSSPIKYITCSILKPKKTEFSIGYLNKKIEPIIIDKGNDELLVWELNNVPALKTDPNTPEFYDPYDLIEISEYKNWEEVIKWGKEIFSYNFKANSKLTEKINEFNLINNNESKLLQALKFVQDEIRYFGIEIGEDSHKPKSPNDVLNNGYGDCKDKSLLLCYLLNQLNIKAYPVLINTNKGEVFYKYLPSPLQFNHAIARVDLDGYVRYFDPTISSQGGSFKTYFTPNYYNGLVIHDSLKGLASIPVNKISEVTLQEKYNLLSIDGNSNLAVKTFYKGREADNVRYRFENSNIKTIEENYFKYYESIYDTIKQEIDLKFKDNRLENIFTTNEQYFIPCIWQDKNKSKLTASFSGSFVRELLDLISIKSKTRKDPLALPFPNFRQHIIEVTLPEKWSINFSENKIENRYLSYYRKISFVNNTLKLTYSIKINQSFVPSYDYQSFKSDLASIIEDLDYQIFWKDELNKKVGDSNINWLIMFMAFLFLVLFSVFFIYLYSKLNNQLSEVVVPRRLGGWLVFPFIGLFLNIVLITITLFTSDFFNKAFWISRTDPTSENYISGFSSLIIFELAINVFFIAFCAFLIPCFIKNLKFVPKLMVIYYISYFLLITIDHCFASILIEPTNLFYLSKDIFRSMFSAAIWIPYFMISSRVKETFVI